MALPPLEAEEPDAAHRLELEELDGEYCVSLDHEMSKSHFISWMARGTSDRFELVGHMAGLPQGADGPAGYIILHVVHAPFPVRIASPACTSARCAEM